MAQRQIHRSLSNQIGHFVRLAGWLVLVGASASASADPDVEARALPVRAQVVAAAPSDFAVGTLRIEVSTGAGRTLPVQLWYPARDSARAEAESGHPLSEIEPPGSRRETLEALLDRKPHDPGTARAFHAASAAPPAAAAAFPLILFSHCLDCTRYSTLSITEHLARLGFVAAAPDHERGTLYDKLAGQSVGFTDDFLDTRVADMRSLLDQLLDPAAALLPDGLRGKLDATRVGAFGHSFGGITTGRLVQDDPRIRAAAYLAIPTSATPLLTIAVARSARIEKLTKPGMYILGSEDFGLFNATIEDNYKKYPGEVWKVALRDASHFSFVDICGIVPDMAMGCGAGIRNTIPLARFTPLDINVVRSQAKQYVGAFFMQTLLGKGAGPADVPAHAAVSVEHKGAR